MIPYGRHHIDKDDLLAVSKVLKSNFITQGPLIKKFENLISKFVGSKYAVVVSSCTAGLHLASIISENTKGKKLLTSPISFVSTANSCLFTGGDVTFADIEEETGNISIESVKKILSESKINSISPVHFGGLPCDMVSIRRLTKRKNIIVYEDAAHSFGAKYNKNNRVGSCKYSDMTVFSFHPVKSIATGEGGCITTNNKKIYDRLIKLRSHGIEKNKKNFSLKSQKNNPWYYEMQELGYHYRTTDIQCALGISQLKKINKFLTKRKKIAKFYDYQFANLNNAIPLQMHQRENSSNHLYILLIDFKKINHSRSEVMKKLRNVGINTQVHYIPITHHPFYKKKKYKNNLSKAENFYQKALSIPIFYDLKIKEQQHITHHIKKILR